MPSGSWSSPSQTESAESDFASDEDIEELRRRISAMHEELENILYNTHLAVGGEVSTKRMSELMNQVAELEKDVFGLGAAITKEDRAEDYTEPTDSIADELPGGKDYANQSDL
ncbi:MAG: hypothetical protein IKZ78_01325 [Firmicutes bacterium]|nr:hypothetical protein [Bacillota bacterium]